LIRWYVQAAYSILPRIFMRSLVSDIVSKHIEVNSVEISY